MQDSCCYFAAWFLQESCCYFWGLNISMSTVLWICLLLVISFLELFRCTPKMHPHRNWVAHPTFGDCTILWNIVPFYRLFRRNSKSCSRISCRLPNWLTPPHLDIRTEARQYPAYDRICLPVYTAAVLKLRVLKVGSCGLVWASCTCPGSIISPRERTGSLKGTLSFTFHHFMITGTKVLLANYHAIVLL